MIRSLCEKVPKGMRWRESRPRILAEAVEWEEGEEGMGTLCVEGVVRGARFSADRLVTLQGFGDFMLEKVCPPPPGSFSPVWWGRAGY